MLVLDGTSTGLNATVLCFQLPYDLFSFFFFLFFFFSDGIVCLVSERHVSRTGAISNRRREDKPFKDGTLLKRVQLLSVPYALDQPSTGSSSSCDSVATRRVKVQFACFYVFFYYCF